MIKKVLEKFSENESKIENLYRHYAILFYQFEALWLGLAQAEKQHATLLKKLTEINTLTDQDLEMNEYSLNILNYISNFIDTKLAEAKSDKINIKSALETALSIEMSMVEKKCFELFNPVNNNISSVFNQLNQETEGHIKILSKALNKF